MKKDHHRELADHDVEHIAVELWNLEEDRRGLVDQLRARMRVADIDATLEELVSRGLLGVDGRKGALSAGADADLVILSESLEVEAVYVRGTQVPVTEN